MIRDGDDNAVLEIVLGSAQLGLAYGISGRDSPPSIDECYALLDLAWENGVRRIDTAPAYGMAEQRIGQYIADRGLEGRLTVCTKLPAVEPGNATILEQVTAHVTASLAALQLDQVDCLLLHNPLDLESYGHELMDALLAQQSIGRAAKLGISVYTPAELTLLESFPMLGTVQLPASIFDQRFLPSLRNGSLATTEVQIRSVFLQGLLTLTPATLPAALADAESPLKDLERLSDAQGIDIMSLALGYACGLPADYLVLGIDNRDQLLNNLTRVKQPPNEELNALLERRFAGLPSHITDPRNW